MEKLLKDGQLRKLLEHGDDDLARECREGGCQQCNGVLHSAKYKRQPLGPEEVAGWDRRHSFCCAEEGCRKRHTPASLRFLGRKAYVSVVVVLVSAMMHGVAAHRVKRLRQVLGINEKTLKRWRAWWLETFAQSEFWKGARGRFMPTVNEKVIPLSLVEAFGVNRAGLIKRKRRGRRNTKGVLKAEARFENLEIRSYESEYVNALWHLDFHAGSVLVVDSTGEQHVPQLLGILDDHSRLCCHAQWYLSETAEDLVHGLCQGLEKRGLPRALMTDNGSAMTAGETEQGLKRLGIHHETTLPYSAYQNGKQEVFWAQVEGRLLAMLPNSPELTLRQLNEATLAWVEMEYNRKVHSELKRTPLDCFVHDRDVGRRRPSSEELRMAFTAAVRRTQRRSDGTISLERVRFELPSRYRHLPRVTLRYASWDLSHVYMADDRTGEILCRIYPLNKRKNADARRRRKEPIVNVEPRPVSGGMAPLLRKLIADYAATGLPPAYLPKGEINTDKENNNHE